MTHYNLAIRWAASAKDSKVSLSIAKQMWNCCVPFASSPLTRRLLQQPLQIVLTKLAEVGEQSDLKLRLRLYMVLLDCYKDAEDWKNGLDTVDEAFQYVPSALQKPLWNVRVIFLSKVGGNVAEGLSKMKQSDASMQARAWINLAESSTDEKAEMSAYLNAIKCVEGTLDCVDCRQLKFAQWLYWHRFPRQDVINYCMAAIDILMELESEAVDDADEVDDDGSRAPSRVSRVTGKTRGSKRSVSRAKSRSSIGSGTRKSSIGASTSVMSSTVIESDDSNGLPPRMEVNQLEQIIRAFCILARVAKRLDERQHFLLLGQMYVKKLLSQVMDACNLKARIFAFTELPEEEREGQTFQQWISQPSNTSTLDVLGIPCSDLEWCNYDIFDSASKIVSENNDTAIFSSGPPAVSILNENDISKMNFINKNTIVNLARTLDFLNEMAAMLIANGYNIYAAPVYHLMYVCNLVLGGDNVGSLTRLTCSRMALNYDALNLKERCKQAFEKCGDCLPSEEELKTYEEDISQREQALLDRNENLSSSSDGVKRRHDSMNRLIVSGIHVRYVWIDQAAVCCLLGNINSAKTLLVEATRHSKAYEDRYCIDRINNISADIQLMEGNLEEGVKYSEAAIYGSSTTVDVYSALTSILRRCNIYAKMRKQSMAVKVLKNAIEAFDALVSLARTGEEVGIGILKKNVLEVARHHLVKVQTPQPMLET